MRILMLSWEYPPRIIGGIARHVDELSKALARTGMEVDVITADHPGAPEREEIAVGDGKVTVIRSWPSPVDPLDFVCEIHQLDFGLTQAAVWEIVNGGRAYDLVHAHDWLVAFAARTLRLGAGLPLVATIHATESGRQGGLSTPMQHYIHSVEWLLTYDAWRVICCSQTMAAEVESALQVPRDKVRVIPNGVDPARLHPHAAPDDLRDFRRRWALDGERIVFFVGRLVREKGLEVLIDAMPEVLAAHPEAKLVVAGGGWWGHLAERAAQRGLRDKVAFAGFVSEEDLRRFYAVADAAVFPSLYEPFGIVALEAMAAGVPVVVSDIGGFREVVRHGETGIHTWANNPGSLAWGIRQVLSDRALAERLWTEARREVEERFGWAAIAEQTAALYTEALRIKAEDQSRAPGPRPGPGVRPRYLNGQQAASRS